MNHEISAAIFRAIPFLIVICVVAILTKRKKIKTEDLDIRKPFSTWSYLKWTVGFLLYALLIEFVLYTFNILEVSKWEHSFLPSVILIFGAILLADLPKRNIASLFLDMNKNPTIYLNTN